jgi:hypothetical protein
MALPLEALKFVRSGLAASERARCPSKRVLSLGYPDILAGEEQLEELFGEAAASRVDLRPDSEAIARWHGLAGVHGIPESHNFFQLLGYELEVLDIAAVRGGELIHDLNHPLPEGLHERYALVIDPGTLEHCFNIGQAAKNVAQMVAVGGSVFHGNPLNMYNHGFYNLNPTWYNDFYAANGFHIELMHAIANPVRAPQRYKVPPTAKFSEAIPGSTVYVLARRVATQAIVWPTQTKYLKNPELKG